MMEKKHEDMTLEDLLEMVTPDSIRSEVGIDRRRKDAAYKAMVKLSEGTDLLDNFMAMIDKAGKGDKLAGLDCTMTISMKSLLEQLCMVFDAGAKCGIDTTVATFGQATNMLKKSAKGGKSK